MVPIIVVFPKLEEAKAIRSLLVKHGLEVACVCTTGAQAAAAVDDWEGGLVIASYRFVDMLYSELRANLPKEFEMLLLVSRTHYPECMGNGLLCLPMPLKSAELIQTVSMMQADMIRKQRKNKKKPKPRSEEEISQIQSAKLMLMKRYGFCEEEAHKYLQKMSMDSGTSLLEMALMVHKLYEKE